MFANDKIRSYHYIPLGKNEIKARFKNTAIGPYGKKSLTPEEEI